MSSSFVAELQRVLPADLPRRDHVIRLASGHLVLIEEINQVMNLTRIVSASDAAIKHVFDSVRPWRHFANARHVLDIGSGAGFPGIPLALCLPDVQFTLAESVQKKARFLADACSRLELPNVQVESDRAEQLLRGQSFDLLTARAVTQLVKAVPLFAPAFRKGASMLFYKGPDVSAEIAEAHRELARFRLSAEVVEHYSLPDDSGQRTLVRVSPGR